MYSLEVDSLSKKYNRHTIIKELSFTHKEGVLGISGSNGSGKSTLLKCLAYLIRPQKGTITWAEDGNTIAKEVAQSQISYCAPYINLYDELTALENLQFLAYVSATKTSANYFNELLQYVHMENYKDAVLKTLSTGQTQRIKLAAALVRQPGILFLDEPGSNLDTKGHALVRQIVADQAQKGTLVVIASNDSNEIDLCDQVVSLSKV
jgi:ABC-type multidrug transport system ATPase subunit